MRQDNLELLNWELKNNLYYLEFPDNVSEYWWKDGNGNWNNMNSMGLDHLKASIRLIEKGIKYLNESGRDQEIKDALLPLAEQKLSELKEVFEKKKEL